MSSTSTASELLKFVQPDISVVVIRYDLAVNFAKLDNRSVREGLRHFAKHFGAATTDKGLQMLLAQMARSNFPEGFRPQLVAYRDKIINRLAKELGVER